MDSIHSNSSSAARSSIDRDSDICDSCATLFRGERQDKPLGVTATTPFPQTLEELQFSANRGCHLCFIRWNDLSVAEKDDLRGCTKVTFGYWESVVGNGIAFEYFYPTGPLKSDRKQCLTKSIGLKLIDTTPFTTDGGISSPITDEDRCCAVARTWIKNCSEKHLSCKRTLPSPYNRRLPDRLLDLKDWPLKSRLCLTGRLPAETKYMTLSHRWGEHVIVKLTLSKFEAFQDYIHPSLLPRTFVEAMNITTNLGIRYLWIDSLCIIQDSQKDWAEQSTVMGNIYHNSWCNLVAIAARDARDGCFGARLPLSPRPCQVQVHWDGKPPKTMVCWSFDLWCREIDDAELNHRGWVLQELILSPRNLYLGSQTFWQCLELHSCEADPNRPLNWQAKLSLNTLSLRNEFWKTGSEMTKQYQLWTKIVQRYSRCTLSNPGSDKLLAINGLARKFFGDQNQYIAGICKEFLPFELMRVVETSMLKTAPTNTGIPSWSWASLNRPILLHELYRDNDMFDIVLRLISAEVPSYRDDYFGQIKPGGYLKLEGPILKADIRRCIGKYNDTKWWLGNCLANVFADEGPFKDGTTIYCLTIQINEDGSEYGIVLLLTGKHRGQFYRCGYFAAFDINGSPDNIQRVKEAHGNLLQPEEYEKTLGVDNRTRLPFYRFTLV